MADRMRLRLSLLAVVAILPLALWAALPVGSVADPTQGQLQSQINRKQALVGGHKKHEQVLTSQVTAYTDKVDGLQSDIDRLAGRQQTLQTSLNAKRAQLARVQQQLRAQQQRLTRLRARLLQARSALAARLVALYKDDKPDVVTVVLESNGFADLLERTEFMQRVSRQDTNIVGLVSSAKAESTATAKRLGGLERQAAHVTAQIQAQRDQVAAAKSGVVDRRDRLAAARRQKNALLASSRNRRHQLEDQIGSLKKASAKIQAKLAAVAGGASPTGSFKAVGNGRLIWPVNGPITSPFCESRAWEACHPGIDIGVPAGTPIHAAAAGKVVLMQPEAASGGYGNFTCIQHTASMSTCYAHQSRFATTMGATVAQGQVIGISGCTGRCYGAHLHFEVRINGSVVNPLNYL
jgi:peptidoglycan DL-endopeptidase CwlO